MPAGLTGTGSVLHAGWRTRVWPAFAFSVLTLALLATRLMVAR